MCLWYKTSRFMPIVYNSVTRTVICKDIFKQIFLGYYNKKTSTWEVCDNYFYTPQTAVEWKFIES